MVDICEVGLESFATPIQELLVDYAQTTATRSPIGVAISGRVSMAGCFSRIVGMQGAIRTWESRYNGVTSRPSALV